MSDIRDALLKAGLVDKKKAKHAERQIAGKKKKKKKKKKKSSAPEQAPEPTEAELEAAAHARILAKVTAITDEGLIEDEGGRRRFYFEARDGKIPFLQLSDVAAIHVENGLAAIVENPRNPEGDHLVVTRDAAIKLLDAEPETVRFFLRG